MPLRDLLLALLVVVIWGLNFVAIKWGVAEVPPFLLTALRYLGCALPAVFFVRKPDVSWRILIAYGFSVGVLQFSFLSRRAAVAGAGGGRRHRPLRPSCHRQRTSGRSDVRALGDDAGRRILLGALQYRHQARRAHRHVRLRRLGEPRAAAADAGHVARLRRTQRAGRAALHFARCALFRAVHRLWLDPGRLWPLGDSPRALSSEPCRALLPAGPDRRFCRGRLGPRRSGYAV